MRSRALNGYLLLAGVFLGALVLCNLIVHKWSSFIWPEWVPILGGQFGWVSAGLLPYPVTFLCTDLMSEIYGRKRASAVVWVGLVVTLLTVGWLALARAVPAHVDYGWAGQWTEAPSESQALAWPTEVLVEIKDSKSGDKQQYRLPPSPEAAPTNPDYFVSELMRKSREAGMPDSYWWAWQEQWSGDLHRKLEGRGRLVFLDTDVERAKRSEVTIECPEFHEKLPQGPLTEIRHTTRVGDELFDHTFGSVWRAMIASMIAYLFAQWFDIRVYHWWKRLTKGKKLWLRNNASTITSQLLDSILVITVLYAFQWPASTIMQAIASAWLFKIFCALIDTPLLYVGVWSFEKLDLCPDDYEPLWRRSKTAEAPVA